MDIREASKIVILEETLEGGTVFKTERGYVITVADELNGIYIPDDIMKKYKTRFFRLRANQGEFILSPAKLQLEVVEDGETSRTTPSEEEHTEGK